MVVESHSYVKGLYLYHFKSSIPSQKVRACLEEKGLEWNGEIVGSKNLVLVHDGVAHTESNEIMVYLDETFPEIHDIRLRPSTVDGKDQVKHWMDLEESIQISMSYITFAFGPVSRNNETPTDRKLEDVKTNYKECHDGLFGEVLRLHIEKIHDALEILDTKLRSHQWLVDDKLTMADLCWGPNVYFCISQLHFPMGRYRGVQDWYKRLCGSSRGFQRGVLSSKCQPAGVAYSIRKGIYGLKSFFGHSVSCCEKETDTSGWKSVLVITLLLAMCLICYPENGITVLQYTVSKLLAIILLSILWLWKFGSSYRLAHAPSRFIYHSRQHFMKAMLTRQYGPDIPMTLEENFPRPKVLLPDDVLVRVKAVSVNPLDVKMKQGYGKDFFNLMRKIVLKDSAYDGKLLPQILGRDFSGVVEHVGSAVTRVYPGDEVWGAAYPSQLCGSLAEYVVTKQQYISKKPTNVNHTEAASITYVAMTTWCVLSKGNVNPENSVGKRVLILGGTGGIGSFGIQLVKAWGGHVTTTCSSRGIELVKRLGADEVVDYTKEDLETVLQDKERFDCVVDTRGPASYQVCFNLCKRGGYMMTLVSPLFTTLDKYGLWLGMIKAGYDFIKVALHQKILHGRTFGYVMVQPDGEYLDATAELVQSNKIEAIVEKTYTLSEANEALEYLAKGHTHGKVVVIIDGNDE